MRKSIGTFEGRILARRGRLFIEPSTPAARRLVDGLSFASGSALFAAIQALVRRLGYSASSPHVRHDNPYAVITGARAVASNSGPVQRLRPLGQKRCFVCTSSGDGGVSCREVKCKERPNA
jgi:hypothetical protein